MQNNKFAAAQKQSDLIAGVGCGKTLDTAKAVSHYLHLPVAVVPSIASTDAPCSALAVIYTLAGCENRQSPDGSSCSLLLPVPG